jgi:hypothetical protein
MLAEGVILHVKTRRETSSKLRYSRDISTPEALSNTKLYSIGTLMGAGALTMFVQPVVHWRPACRRDVVLNEDRYVLTCQETSLARVPSSGYQIHHDNYCCEDPLPMVPYNP